MFQLWKSPHLLGLANRALLARLAHRAQVPGLRASFAIYIYIYIYLHGMPIEELQEDNEQPGAVATSAATCGHGRGMDCSGPWSWE